MGEVARNLVRLSGPTSVHGIIPEALLPIECARSPVQSTSSNSTTTTHNPPTREAAFGRLTIVKDMHTRKSMMAAEAGAFVAMPGGFGTMEELMEIITWNFLGIHSKPIVLFNVDGFYDDMLRWVRRAVEEEFVDWGNRDIVVEARGAEEVVERIRGYEMGTQRLEDLKWGMR